VTACGSIGETANGGEPLWTVPKNPVIFVSARGRPEIALNKRLPRTFQRVLGYGASSG
jgi:hypothetical protein